jgi:hypothetical protein
MVSFAVAVLSALLTFPRVYGEEKCLSCHTDEGKLKRVIEAEGLEAQEAEASSMTKGEG